MVVAARFDLGARTLTRDEERAIAGRLAEGALVIYPTDTLYALGCLALEGRAIRSLREAKGREEDKPLPVIVADVFQARSMAAIWSEAARCLAEAFWPGPLTLVVPAAASLPPELLAGAPGVALRVPASASARLLARIAGPLVSTSANLAGQPVCQTVESAMAAFPSAGLVFDSGPLEGAPSTIVDLTGGEGSIHVLREGRIGRGPIEEALRLSRRQT